MSVSTLLEYIHALERAVRALRKRIGVGGGFELGENDQERLITFFGGPGRFDASRARVKADRDLAEAVEEKRER